MYKVKGRDYKEEIDLNRNKIIIAEINGKIIGYFMISIDKPKPYINFDRIEKIKEAYVDEDYRGFGIGKLLFEKALEYFKENGIKIVMLSVDVRNNLGVKFWRSLGFEPYMYKMKLIL